MINLSIFLQSNTVNINDKQSFNESFNNLLTSKNELYSEKEENRKSDKRYSDYITEFIEFQNSLLKDYTEHTDKIINNKVNQLIQYYNHCEYDDKKSCFNLIMDEFENILRKEDSEKLLEMLEKSNRKKFEQIIVSENVEEYELLKKVTSNNHSIKDIKNEEKQYAENNQEIIRLNKKLLSSKSWKLTKFLRIKEKLKF